MPQQSRSSLGTVLYQPQTPCQTESTRNLRLSLELATQAKALASRFIQTLQQATRLSHHLDTSLLTALLQHDTLVITAVMRRTPPPLAPPQMISYLKKHIDCAFPMEGTSMKFDSTIRPFLAYFHLITPAAIAAFRHQGRIHPHPFPMNDALHIHLESMVSNLPNTMRRVYTLILSTIYQRHYLSTALHSQLARKPIKGHATDFRKITTLARQLNLPNIKAATAASDLIRQLATWATNHISPLAETLCSTQLRRVLLYTPETSRSRSTQTPVCAQAKIRALLTVVTSLHPHFHLSETYKYLKGFHDNSLSLHAVPDSKPHSKKVDPLVLLYYILHHFDLALQNIDPIINLQRAINAAWCLTWGHRTGNLVDGEVRELHAELQAGFWRMATVSKTSSYARPTQYTVAPELTHIPGKPHDFPILSLRYLTTVLDLLWGHDRIFILQYVPERTLLPFSTNVIRKCTGRSIKHLVGHIFDWATTWCPDLLARTNVQHRDELTPSMFRLDASQVRNEAGLSNADKDISMQHYTTEAPSMTAHYERNQHDASRIGPLLLDFWTARFYALQSYVRLKQLYPFPPWATARRPGAIPLPVPRVPRDPTLFSQTTTTRKFFPPRSQN